MSINYINKVSRTIKNCVVLISGNGTNLQAIINAVKNKNINMHIKAVISNRKNAYGLKRAELNNIDTHYIPYIKSKVSRKDYDELLKNKILELNPDLIICAGWMHILSKEFLENFDNIINLHPALPGQFPGNNSIEDAYNSFKSNLVDHTGIMVHHVIPEIDAGKIILTKKIQIYKNDELNDLKSRIQYYEKYILIQSIYKMTTHNKIRSGKVRDLYDYSNEAMVIFHSDRISAFDKNLCNINGKGNVLCNLANWWFDKTRHIIDNHVIAKLDNSLLVNKCEVIPIEFVVRGYITGNTSTSLWTHYNNGSRNYCGNPLPEGLTKHQRLSEPLLTPTTKDVHDEPISCEEIVNRNILTQEELDYIRDKSFLLFSYGQQVAELKDLILVDTKYEFGKTSDGRIVLIDEVHTCDSSRYWKRSTYQQLIDGGKEPEKLDKDSIRDYVKSVCDPYKDAIPEIPEEYRERVYTCYNQLYEQLTGEELQRLTFNDNDINTSIDSLTKVYGLDDSDLLNRQRNIVIIVAGSTSDRSHVEKIEKELDSFNIDHHSYAISAHKNTQKLLNLLTELKACPKRKIFVTVAGRSNALSGVVACNCNYPVIACPPFKDKMDMFTNINSSLQCPSKTPVMTILEPNNVAISCSRIFNL